MFQLKPIEKAAITRALAKAERYRLLNEPREAESICRDVLAVDPDNQEAKISLALAMTDLFSMQPTSPQEARRLVASLRSEFDREYFSGVVEERWGKRLFSDPHMSRGAPHHILAAMRHFERADALAEPGNDDAVLRWNTCVRMLERAGYDPEALDHDHESIVDEDMPIR